MANGAFLRTNLAAGITPAVFSSASGYAAADLSDNVPSTAHRSTGRLQTIEFDFVTAKDIHAVSLHNHNLADGDAIVATFASDPMTEIVVDGGLEIWSSATNLTNWTEGLAGTSTVNREASAQHYGTYCARLDVDASNSTCSISQSITLTAGAKCRLVLWYKMSTTGKTAYVLLRDSASNQWLKDDGTWQGSTTSIVLANSTTWKKFEIVFAAHASYTAYSLQLNRSSAASSSIYLDDITLKRCDVAIDVEPQFYAANMGAILAATQTYRYAGLYVFTANAAGYVEAGEACFWGADFTPSRNYNWEFEHLIKLYATKNITSGQVYRNSNAIAQGYRISFSAMTLSDFLAFADVLVSTPAAFFPDKAYGECLHGIIDNDQIGGPVLAAGREFSVDFIQNAVRVA